MIYFSCPTPLVPGPYKFIAFAYSSGKEACCEALPSCAPTARVRRPAYACVSDAAAATATGRASRVAAPARSGASQYKVGWSAVFCVTESQSSGRYCTVILSSFCQCFLLGKVMLRTRRTISNRPFFIVLISATTCQEIRETKL